LDAVERPRAAQQQSVALTVQGDCWRIKIAKSPDGRKDCRPIGSQDPAVSLHTIAEA